MEGWQTKPLGRLCVFKPQKVEARKKLADGDSVSFVPMEDLGIGLKHLIPKKSRSLREVSGSYTYFAEGDVLLAKITPCFENGKLGIARGLVNGIGFGSSEFFVLRPLAELSSEFLYYYLSRPVFREEGARSMTGAVGHKRVAKEFIESYPVPVPPLREQRRIVAILDEAFEAIATAKANAEKNLQNAQELHAAARSAAFSQVMTSAPRARLADVVDRLTNGYVGPIRGVYVDEGVPYLLARHVRDNRLQFDGKTYVSAAFNLKHRKSTLKAGDLLLVQSGHIGHCAVVGPEHVGHNCHAMIVITPRPGLLLGAYLAEFFYTAETLTHFESIRSGSTVPHLTCGEVREISIPVPAINIQQQVIERMSDVADARNDLEEILNRKAIALDDLKKSLMHQAFTGQLTAKSTDRQLEAVA